MSEAVKPFTPEEVERFRADTPGCANVCHFGHCGASLMPGVVIETVINHIRLEGDIGGYEAADLAHQRSARVYDSVAGMLGAKRAEIALVENATRGWDMAFYAIPFQPGDRILTSVSEYASNVLAFLQKRNRGVITDIVPNDDLGQISLTHLEAMLDPSVRLVAVSHMPTNGGLVQPVDEVGALTQANGSLFLVDACQTVGQLPIDVSRMKCDFLSGTSRKFLRGPRGAGFLFAREELAATMEPPFVDLHAATWDGTSNYSLVPDARRFENWERNVSGLLGMGAAIDYAISAGLDRIWTTVQQKAALLRDRLSSIPGVTVRDIGRIRGGIVAFDVAGRSSQEVVDHLKLHKINTGTTDISSTRFDMEARDLLELVRTSVHYFTSVEEVEQLAGAIETLA